METQTIRKKLLAISNLVESLIGELSNSPSNTIETTKRSTCPVCDEPMAQHDPDNGRGVHARCYKRLQRENRLQESEAVGILLPKQKAGRKKLIDVDAIIDKSKDLKKKPGRNTKNN